MTKLLRFLKSTEAATAVEYAVMIGLIILACFTAVISVGQQNSASLSTSSDSIQNAMSSSSSS